MNPGHEPNAGGRAVPVAPAAVQAPTAPAASDPLQSAPVLGDDSGWCPLAEPARRLFAATGAVSVALASAVACIPLGFGLVRGLGLGTGVAWIGLLPVLGAVIGWRIGSRRWQYSRWRLDADGFALRRGRLWQRETRVPIARVQHLDLKRGPLERRRGLATLVLHTAGSQSSTVGVGGLALSDAEALRDRLMRPVQAAASSDRAQATDAADGL